MVRVGFLVVGRFNLGSFSTGSAYWAGALRFLAHLVQRKSEIKSVWSDMHLFCFLVTGPMYIRRRIVNPPIGLGQVGIYYCHDEHEVTLW